MYKNLPKTMKTIKMIQSNIDELAEDLERQELEKIDGVNEAVYAPLLAIYLYRNDLCNAKFLWKRIPVEVKVSCPELGNIWKVGQKMWQRDFRDTYEAIRGVNWSESVVEIMHALLENVRQRAIDLIVQAYSSVSLDVVASMTGFTIEQAKVVCAEKGWKIDLDSNMVNPIQSPAVPPVHTASEDQLYKLTGFVSFLEN